MKFTEQIASETEIKVDGRTIYLNFKNGPSETLQIGEEVETACWSEHFYLLVSLSNGQVRLYRDPINYTIV